ncbi:MAG: SH3 domain-containing protein [Lachnospiraceae bacterium]|nr:SH3 domain-containing protein [Lachnospiraceae bacterium]
MKKKTVSIILASVLTMAMLVGCGSTEAVNTTEKTEDGAEASHEHSFREEITKEATCLEAGEKTLTCECGETKTEIIEAIGHTFENYVSNEDATYEADGTETGTCSVCGETDTRVAEGSMLTYTFEDMEATKYAKSTVNVRSLPDSDGEKLGGLSQNDEVKVTGKCIETGWYRIEYSDGVAYVSDSYLVDNKVETQSAEAPANNDGGSTASASSEFPYQLYVVYYDESLDLKYYYKPLKATFFDYPQAIYDESMRYNRDHHSTDGINYPDSLNGIIGTHNTKWKTEDGDIIIKYYSW